MHFFIHFKLRNVEIISFNLHEGLAVERKIELDIWLDFWVISIVESLQGDVKVILYIYYGSICLEIKLFNRAIKRKLLIADIHLEQY